MVCVKHADMKIMPKIYFGQDHRIIGACFTGRNTQWDFDDMIEGVYEKLNEERDYVDEVFNPFITEEEWYISGLKYPELISIDSTSSEIPVAPWKISYNQEYGHRKRSYLKMYTKGEYNK